MALPGFAAEAALYRSRRSYRGVRHGTSAPAVRPQAMMEEMRQFYEETYGAGADPGGGEPGWGDFFRRGQVGWGSSAALRGRGGTWGPPGRRGVGWGPYTREGGPDGDGQPGTGGSGPAPVPGGEMCTEADRRLARQGRGAIGSCLRDGGTAYLVTSDMEMPAGDYWVNGVDCRGAGPQNDQYHYLSAPAPYSCYLAVGGEDIDKHPDVIIE